jgi:urease accessory protein UreF
MAFEWQMVDESIQDADKIEHWLQTQFEPFAVEDGRVYMKRMVNVERDDKASEVLGEPSERTTEVEVEDVDSGGA